MKQWGDTKSQINKRANKLRICERKVPFKTQADAEGRAKVIARTQLRQGMVQKMRAYECPVSDPVHYHLTSYGSPFAIGYAGTRDARGWAKELGIKWTDEDDATCAAQLRRWEDEAKREATAYTRDASRRSSYRRNSRSRSGD